MQTQNIDPIVLRGYIFEWSHNSPESLFVLFGIKNTLIKWE